MAEYRDSEGVWICECDEERERGRGEKGEGRGESGEWKDRTRGAPCLIRWLRM